MNDYPLDDSTGNTHKLPVDDASFTLLSVGPRSSTRICMELMSTETLTISLNSPFAIDTVICTDAEFDRLVPRDTPPWEYPWHRFAITSDSWRYPVDKTTHLSVAIFNLSEKPADILISLAVVSASPPECAYPMFIGNQDVA